MRTFDMVHKDCGYPIGMSLHEVHISRLLTRVTQKFWDNHGNSDNCGKQINVCPRCFRTIFVSDLVLQDLQVPHPLDR